jgi:hypothetical protein
VYPVSYRPLAFVSGLTLGDYLLWNWSLNANHDVLALVSGLTLPPIALALVGMLAVNLMRLIGTSTRRSARGATITASSAAGEQDARGARRPRTSKVAGGGREDSSGSSGSSPPSSGKLAA